ncbi:hypothetical protein [Bacillus solitudinis]|nr:hypothetical protein [Bacillus solitudinis]
MHSMVAKVKVTGSKTGVETSIKVPANQTIQIEKAMEDTMNTSRVA